MQPLNCFSKKSYESHKQKPSISIATHERPVSIQACIMLPLPLHRDRTQSPNTKFQRSQSIPGFVQVESTHPLAIAGFSQGLRTSLEICRLPCVSNARR